MKFSIIIPVYNGEEYLPRCFKNISALKFDNLEIIFINDGSLDNSKSMIENFASKDNRVIFINRISNGGTGSAYRAAFDSMTGDYVSFTDCDDLLKSHIYNDLASIIKKYDKPDMIHFGAIMQDTDGRLIQNFPTLNKYVTNNNDIIENHYKILKEPVLCYRVVRKELFKDIYCPDQATAIDEILTPQLLLRCNSVYYTKSIYFTGIMTENSVSRRSISQKKLNEEIFALDYV